MDAIVDRIDHFKPYELSTVVYALVHWGVDLDPRWMVSCMSYLDKNMDDFDANAVCSLIWSLARYRVSHCGEFKNC